MRQRFSTKVTTAALLVSLVAFAVAQGDVAEYPAFTITITGDGIEVPAEPEAGFYRLEIVNEGAATEEQPEVAVDRLKEGTEVDEVVAGYEQLMQAFRGEGNPGEAIQELTQLVEAISGASQPNALFELTPGEYMVSTIGEGFTYVTFTVAEASSEVQPPQADLTVDMMEFAFTIPEEVPAGAQLWEIQNVGDQVHHLILFRIHEGKTIEDVMNFLQTEEGEPPADEVGYTSILSPGISNFVAFDLEPGEYVAICFVPDYETGQPHVALGMIDSFTVTGD